jgi:dihydrolipoamide dehydrogenase
VTMNDTYDLAVIGAGWAGFHSAHTAQKNGARVILIEAGPIGGTCLNRGCIPTKTLLQSAKVFSLTKKSAQFGVDISSAQLNFSAIMQRKERVVSGLRAGMSFMLKGVEVVAGKAFLHSADTITVGDRTINARASIIASGSKPFALLSLPFDGKKIISSDEALCLAHVPASLLVVGGGVVGCEFASLFSALGSQVTIVEKLPQLLPGIDKETAKKLESAFKKKSIHVLTSADAGAMDLNNFEKVLVCVGRAPLVEGFGLVEAGVILEGCRIKVDEYLMTSVPSIYAAGDCAAPIMLAHYAAYQGEIAAYNALHPEAPRACDTTAVPGCIFTDPEVACVGITEEQALSKGNVVTVQRFDFQGSGMARILDEAEGFVKILTEKNTQAIVGACIIGPRATELISILTLAISAKLTLQTVRDTIFAHPTLSEAIHEASLKA